MPPALADVVPAVDAATAVVVVVEGEALAVMVAVFIVALFALSGSAFSGEREDW